MSPPFSITLTTGKAFRKGFRIGESPIVYHERKVGGSKLKWKIIREAIFGVRLGVGR